MKKILEAIKAKAKRVAVAVGTVATLAVTTGAAALASDGHAGQAQAALTTGFQSIVGDIIQIVLLVIPIGLGLVGLVIAVRRGIDFFRNLTNKG